MGLPIAAVVVLLKNSYMIEKVGMQEKYGKAFEQLF